MTRVRTVILALLLIGAALLVGTVGTIGQAVPAPAASPLLLCYGAPAAAFEEALPLGNGRLGALAFGGTSPERILLNESTLWSGGPVDPAVNPEAITWLPKVREALFKGDYKRADELTRKLQGRFSESYAPLGDLYIDSARRHVDDGHRASSRTRPCHRPSARTTFAGGRRDLRARILRFASRAVMVIRLTSSRPGALSFAVGADEPAAPRGER